MHQNRTIYTLREYQDIVAYRWKHTLFWFARESENPGKYDLYFAKPAPRTVWLPGRPRKKYYNRLKNRVHCQIAHNATKYTFATLTYSTGSYTPNKAFFLMKSHIKEFFRLLRKRIPTLQYFWVVELTKRGYPHFHLILSSFVHHSVLKAIWWKVSSCSVVDIRMIPAGNLSGYITKYLTKQSKHTTRQFEIIFKKIDRLYGYSKKFFTKKEPTDSEKWFMISLSLDCFVQDHNLLRPDKEIEFWQIPPPEASFLLWSHSQIDHIDWFNDYPDIYTSIIYSRETNNLDMEQYYYEVQAMCLAYKWENEIDPVPDDLSSPIDSFNADSYQSTFQYE